MKIIRVLSVALTIVIIFFSTLYFSLGVVVPPNKIGVRRNIRPIPGLLKSGFQPEGLEPGLHWQLPGYSEVRLIPRDFQFLNFGNAAAHIGGDFPTNPVLRIPTADGSIVATDITMVLRYFEKPGELEARPSRQPMSEDGIPLVASAGGTHAGPSELVKTYSLAHDAQLKQIVQRVDPMVKKNLSRLSTSDFYNPALRELETLKAQDSLNKALNPFGVQIWGTLVHRYVYEKTAIDAQIFDKNLQEQTKSLNTALKKLSEEKAVTREVLAALDADIEVLKAKQTSAAAAIRSKGDLYEAQKKAEGDLLVAKAEAEVTSKKKEILNEKQSKTYVAYEMVPVLSTLKGGVVGNLDPYDIDSWVERLGGMDEMKSAGPK